MTLKAPFRMFFFIAIAFFIQSPATAEEGSGVLVLVKLNPAYEGDIAPEAEVSVRFIISERGNVDSLEIIDAEGLDNNALTQISKALKLWKFKPYAVNRQPYPSEAFYLFKATKKNDTISLTVKKRQSYQLE